MARTNGQADSNLRNRVLLLLSTAGVQPHQLARARVRNIDPKAGILWLPSNRAPWLYRLSRRDSALLREHLGGRTTGYLFTRPTLTPAQVSRIANRS